MDSVAVAAVIIVLTAITFLYKRTQLPTLVVSNLIALVRLRPAGHASFKAQHGENDVNSLPVLLWQKWSLCLYLRVSSKILQSSLLLLTCTSQSEAQREGISYRLDNLMLCWVVWGSWSSNPRPLVEQVMSPPDVMCPSSKNKPTPKQNQLPVKHIDSRLITAPTLFVLIDHHWGAAPPPSPLPFSCPGGAIVAAHFFRRLDRLRFTWCFTCEYVHVICMGSVNRWQSLRFPRSEARFHSKFLVCFVVVFSKDSSQRPSVCKLCVGNRACALRWTTCKEAWERCLLSMHCFVFFPPAADDT